MAKYILLGLAFLCCVYLSGVDVAVDRQDEAKAARELCQRNAQFKFDNGTFCYGKE